MNLTPEQKKRKEQLKRLWWDAARGGAYEHLERTGRIRVQEAVKPMPYRPGAVDIATCTTVRAAVGFTRDEYRDGNGKSRYRIKAEGLEIYTGPIE